MESKGGMYEILILVDKLLSQNGKKEFEAKDILCKSDLCKQTISNNLTRLVNAGLLERYESWNRTKEKRGRVVVYSLSPGAKEFIHNNLY